MSSVNHKRIAKNTIALYIRMGITVLVSLYTSRIVLEKLGVDDYGVYNVVGGTVAMLGFLNAAMAGATSRFITFEFGKENKQRLIETFGSAVIIHYFIAALIFVIAETFGLWFVNTRLVIPESSMLAANVVYQLSVISSCVSVIQAPYNAEIVSHEKFTIYAYVEILNVVLKLLVVYLLVIVSTNKLILYAFLTFVVQLIVFFIYRFYCHRFEETRGKLHWNKEIAKPMLQFSGWDLFGNLSVAVNFQGYGIAMNMICGAAINAAYGIANTVQGTLKGLAANVIAASRPQIIKSYAAENIDEMMLLMRNASNMSIVMYLMLAVPLFFNAETVLGLWLVNVPPHSAVFLKIVLVSGIFNLLNQVLNAAVHATGVIRPLSVYPGIIYLLSPFVCYFLMKTGLNVDSAFCIIIAAYFLCLLICLIIVKRLIPEFRLNKFVLKNYLPLIPLIGLVAIILFFDNSESPYIKLLVDIILSSLVLGTYFLIFCLDRRQRQSLYNKLNALIISGKKS